MTQPNPLPDINRDHQCYHYQAPTGERCGSPAMKGEYYCYHHLVRNAKQTKRVLIDPEVTCMEIPPIEDRPSIFLALAAVVHRLAENTIDTRRAGQMIYGLQVAMQALEPPPAPRCRTTPSAPQSCHPERREQTEAEEHPRNCHPERRPAPAQTEVEEPVLSSSKETAVAPPAPKTVQITKEALIYFLRARHCYKCNAELFPASELTFRRNMGAKPEVIEENDIMIARQKAAAAPTVTPEASPALPAAPSADDQYPATVLPALHAAASHLGPETPNLEPGASNLAQSPLLFTCEAGREPHEMPRFALHSPRRSVSLNLARTSPGILVSSGPARSEILNPKANRRTKWQQ